MPGSTPEVIRVADKLASIDERWSPRLLAELNGQEVKIAKIQGEFVWHRHADADEMFLVLEGSFTMQLRGARGVRSLELGTGDMIVIPRGVEHRPVAERACSIMLFEPAGVVNTGDAPRSGLTRDRIERV